MPLISLYQAIPRIGRSVPTVYRWANAGELDRFGVFRIGERFYITEADLDRHFPLKPEQPPPKPKSKPKRSRISIG